MRPRQQEVTFDDLFTADGVPLDFHSAIQYRINDSVKLVRDFGADDGPNGMGFFARNLEQSYRMIVRDAVKKHGLNEMAITVTAAQSVDDEVTARFSEIIAKNRRPDHRARRNAGPRDSTGRHQAPAYRHSRAGAAPEDGAASQARRGSTKGA
jgi:regulator of protease activity HflC (stomatin/prohibitin superfamily)